MWRWTKDQLEDEDEDDSRNWVEREVAATARCSADLQPETATIRRIAKALRRIRDMKTKMARDEETIMTQAEKILLWSAMSKDDVLEKIAMCGDA